MIDLIQELEQAQEGSRELDARIAAELRILPATAEAESWMKSPGWGFAPHPTIKPGRVALIHSDGTPGVHWAVPHYTTNLQDALGLVPEGWCGDVEVGDCGQLEKRRAQLWNGEFAPDAKEARGSAATPALALTIAALKARQEEP